MSDGADRDPFPFRCPACGSALETAGDDLRRCEPGCGEYPRVEEIWRFLPPSRAAFFERFAAEYEAVRQAERRGSDDPAYYRALPHEDRTGRFAADWRIRAKSFRVLLDAIVRPLEKARSHSLRIVDLGAGNGWLADRLALAGHRVAAVDLLVNDRDGLGAYPRYARNDAYPGSGAVVPVQAEFDRLPFATGEFDVAVFNGSLHYSTDYAATLREALRVMDAAGTLVIMDSPVYRDASSGVAMVREREERFERAYGFRSDALPSENYLTRQRLFELAAQLGLRWRTIRPFYGMRWALRPWKARLLGRREPARFLILAGRRENGG